MIDVLIISKEAGEIYAVIEQCVAPEGAQEAQSPPTRTLDMESPADYDVALLDLDADGWQQMLLDLKLLSGKEWRTFLCSYGIWCASTARNARSSQSRGFAGGALLGDERTRRG